MSRIHLAALLAVAALALPASTAFAQGTVAPGSQGTVAPGSQGTVAPGSQGTPDRKLNAPPSRAQCSATTTTQYEQRNSVARINSTLAIADCTLASGAFVVVIRVKDESGTEKPRLEFNETWQRSDANDVSFTADYPIGENVDLVSVRLRGLTCTCGAAEQQPLAEEVTPAAPP